MSIRTERVAGVVQQALTRPLSEVAEALSAGLVTVTHVRMSPDLRIANVYLSIFGGKMPRETALERIRERVKHIRHEVAGAVQLRFAPEIRFFLDDSLDTMERIDQLLKEARERESGSRNQEEKLG